MGDAAARHQLTTEFRQVFPHGWFRHRSRAARRRAM